MKKLALSLIALAMGTAGAFAQTFPGNGATGFGDQIGSGTLTASVSGGTVTFTLTAGPSGLGNDLALYIDSTAGGFSDTSTFTDTADGGRRTLSGKGATTGQSVVTFAPGFTADFGIDLTASSANLFALNTGSFIFTLGANFVSTVGNVTTFTLSLASIGNPITSFGLVGNIVNPNDNAGGNNNDLFRSNETFGTSTTNPPLTNPGNNGTLTFSSFDIVVVPEPSTWMMMLGGLGMLVLLRRRRTA
ncbi:MAG: PEP-CTERM sorting domain-containing protein [Chthoniobacterales bacterium]|nr:PEP-CTERM sorting domain-containing protein [Chthoniobacterales bacterium]